MSSVDPDTEASRDTRFGARHGFGLFLFGQTVSAFGDAFSEVAMPLLVLAITGSIAQMGLVAGVSAACQLAAGFVAGAIVERADRRLLMIAGDILQMVIGGTITIVWWLMPAATWSHWAMWIIYPAVVLSSLLYTIYKVALRTLLPQLVGRSALTKANSRLTLNTEIAFGLGPAIAGLAVTWLGAPVAIGINALTFGMSGLALAVLRLRPLDREAGGQDEVRGLARELSGLRFLWRNRFLRALGVLDVANTLLVAGAVSLFIFYVRHDLRQGSAVVGLLLSLGSVGAAAGAMVAAPLRARFGVGPGWLISVAIQGIALAGVSLSGSIWAVAVLAMVFALGQVSAAILALSRRQELTPDGLMPRVSAAVVTLMLAAQSAGTIGLTSAADHIPIRDVFVTAGVLTLAVAVAGIWTAVRGDQSRADSSSLPARRPLPRPVNLGLAAVVTAVVLVVCATGIGATIPPLGSTFNPVTGAWGTMAAGAPAAGDQTLRLAGLGGKVLVSFDSAGIPTIHAASAADAFFAQGFVTAHYRLLQMDLLRREGTGTLAQVLGAGALSSDKTELTLGLGRTAKAIYSALPPSGMARQALRAYAAGVNAAIGRIEAADQLPTAMQLLDDRPVPWTPLDSLVVQGDLTQTLDFTTTPLDNALLARALGRARAQAWFPGTEPTPQAPFDPGPYQRRPLAKIGAIIPGTAAAPPVRAVPTVAAAPPRGPNPPDAVHRGGSTAVASALRWLRALPSAMHRYGASNAWAVAGWRSSTGAAMLASDPHLQQTLPSIWYQVVIDTPGLHVSGVSVPGLPGVVIGRTPGLAWGLTDTQNQSTLFYREAVNPRNPDYYLWRGAWHPFRLVHYLIQVKGAAPVRYTVRVGVHGPMFTAARQTTAVWWAGALPSDDLDALFSLYRAGTPAQVRHALAGWLAPTENFVYATSTGHIGIYSPGIYPQVHAGDPAFPLSGAGADDVAGTIPRPEIPQVSDPRSGIVVSSNQRPVTAAYPYYIGTSAAFDPGYRAQVIQSFLTAHRVITLGEMEQLQRSLTDRFAADLVPYLLAALDGRSSRLTTQQRTAMTILRHWHYSMTANSAASTIWWTFLSEYMDAVFGPWWRERKVPVKTDNNLRLSPDRVSLDEDLQTWTERATPNAAVELPGGTKQNLSTTMTVAFDRAVAELSRKLGRTPQRWAWGRLHSSEFPSLTGARALGYGPRGSGGDIFTPDAADGYPVSTSGPSWRMVVSFAGGSAGVFPGGQSEDPLSPWYENFVKAWWDGRYWPLPSPEGTLPATGRTWTLLAAGRS
jgi:penicillin amidase